MRAQDAARPTGRRWAGTLGTSAAIASVLLAVLALLPAGVGASPILAGSSPPASWAYGGGTNLSLNVTANHTSYSVRGWFAYHVVLTQTNTSSSNFTVEVDRTLGFGYHASGSYCASSCLAGRISANISVDATEHDVGFANFTRAGTVVVAGAPAPALALTNSSLSTDARYSESVNYTATLPARVYAGQSDLTVQLTTASDLAFSPPLGLVPLSLSPGTSWSSTSRYTAAASADGTVSYHRTGLNGTTVSGGFSFDPGLNGSGSVTLNGTDEGTVTLRDGERVPVLLVSISGPFAPREGFLLVPSSADLYGKGAGAYAGHAAGGAATGTEAVDWQPGGAAGHAGFVASSTGLAPQPDARAQSGAGPAGGPIVPAVGVAVAPAGGVAVQAQPESVSAARSGSQCILRGIGVCLPGTPGGSSPGRSAGLLGGLIVVGAVILLGALLGALVATRRRVPPPPPSATPPYPPAGHPPAPLLRLPPAPPDGEAEPDPLGHLW